MNTDESDIARESATRECIRGALEYYSDYPKPGVNFVDVMAVLRNPEATQMLVTHLAEHVRACHGDDIEVIVGCEARGLVIGVLLASHLGLPFVPLRKRGKLPGIVIRESYALEYGTDELELCPEHVEGKSVVIVDDLLATGGTLAAAEQLLKRARADVRECIVVVEMAAFNGWRKLETSVYAVVRHEAAPLAEPEREEHEPEPTRASREASQE